MSLAAFHFVSFSFSLSPRVGCFHHLGLWVRKSICSETIHSKARVALSSPGKLNRNKKRRKISNKRSQVHQRMNEQKMSIKNECQTKKMMKERKKKNIFCYLYDCRAIFRVYHAAIVFYRRRD